MNDSKIDETLVGLAADAWGRYLESLDGLRPDLFRYCRRLTGNAWDAEDLVHDTLEQGFARIGMRAQGVDNPRGYVLRIASNLWISRQRRERVAERNAGDPQAQTLAPAAAPSPETGTALRDAGSALLQHLAPQERAAVLLKETFDLTAEEIAEALGTTPGAVKAALHRGRERLREADSAPPRNPVSQAVIDRFVERYNARDLPGLLALMLDNAAIEMPGVEEFVGRKAFGRKRSWFYFNFYTFDGKPSPASWEAASFQGEPVVLVLNPRNGQTSVTSVMRLETHEDHVSRILVYAMCPDTVREVAAVLGRPYGAMGRYQLPRAITAQIAAAVKKANAEGNE